MTADAATPAMSTGTPGDPSHGAAPRRACGAGDEAAGGDEDAGGARRGRLCSVNVGRPIEILWHARNVRTAIWKTAVTGPVRARGANLVGDAQADRSAHGGPDKAVYAYAAEDLEWWSSQLGLVLGPGHMGENLTTIGLDLSEAVVGEAWQVGSVLLQVTQPRIPCYKLGIRMGDDRFPERFAEARRHGVYLRILAEGELRAGDEILVIDRPAHGFGAIEVAHIFYDQHHRARELLDVAELAESWHSWARRVLAPAR
jgi:MOSC domain-containing protein YiiM